MTMDRADGRYFPPPAMADDPNRNSAAFRWPTNRCGLVAFSGGWSLRLRRSVNFSAA